MANKNEKEKHSESVHIEQLVTGFIRFGDAGIDKKRKEQGYVSHLCTIDENGRFVDLALKKEHLKQIRDGADDMLKTLERKEKSDQAV